MALQAENYDPALMYGAEVKANDIASDAVGSSQIIALSVTTAKLDSDAVTNAKMANDAIKQAELDYEIATVTVATTLTTGTAACTASSQVLGWYPSANAGEFGVKSIAESSGVVTLVLTGTVVTTGVYKVVLLKA